MPIKFLLLGGGVIWVLGVVLGFSGSGGGGVEVPIFFLMGAGIFRIFLSS